MLLTGVTSRAPVFHHHFWQTPNKAGIRCRDQKGVSQVVGLPDHEYASFRIGAATSAALAGIEDSTIQLLGRWQSGAFLCYIRTPQEILPAVSASLAAQAQRAPRIVHR